MRFFHLALTDIIAVLVGVRESEEQSCNLAKQTQTGTTDHPFYHIPTTGKKSVNRFWSATGIDVGGQDAEEKIEGLRLIISIMTKKTVTLAILLLYAVPVIL
jgi:hypothetical protein